MKTETDSKGNCETRPARGLAPSGFQLKFGCKTLKSPRLKSPTMRQREEETEDV